jgi:hypothetical protein
MGDDNRRPDHLLEPDYDRSSAMMLTKGQVNQKIRTFVGRKIRAGAWTEDLAAAIAERYEEYDVSKTRVLKIARGIEKSIAKKDQHLSMKEQRKLHKGAVRVQLQDRTGDEVAIGTGFRYVVPLGTHGRNVIVLNPITGKRHKLSRDVFTPEQLADITETPA